MLFQSRIYTHDLADCKRLIFVRLHPAVDVAGSLTVFAAVKKS